VYGMSPHGTGHAEGEARDRSERPHGTHGGRAVDVETGRVGVGARAVVGDALVAPTVAHAGAADVHVTYHVTVPGYVLTHHEPVDNVTRIGPSRTC
jgi:hypothetical protein